MEIKCSKCSKLNEEGVEVCIHCGASLIETMGGEQQSSAGDPVEDLLASLRVAGSIDTEGEVPDIEDEPQEDPEESEEDVPDWLLRIRKMTDEEETQKDEWIPSESEDVPDWLSDLAPQRDEETSQTDSDYDAEPERETEELLETAFLANEAELPEEVERDLQWLQEIELEKEAHDETDIDLSTDSGEDGQDELTTRISETLMEGLPNWLEETGSKPDERAGVERAEEEGPLVSDDLITGFEINDDGIRDAWEDEKEEVDLTSLEAVEESQPLSPEPMDLEKELEALDFVQDDDLTQWISSLQAEIENGEGFADREDAPLDMEGEASGDEEVSLDMGDLSLEPEGDEDTYSISDEPDPSMDIRETFEEFPSISEQDSATPLPQMIEERLPQTQDESEIHDWMSLREEESLSSKSDVDGLPDWMTDSETSAHDDPFPMKDQVPSEDEEDELPGWLFGEEAKDIKEDDGRAGLKAVETEEDVAGQLEEEDLSEWLGDLTSDRGAGVFDTKRETGTGGDLQSETPPFIGRDLGDWMKGEVEKTPEEGEQPPDDAGEDESLLKRSEELPDWLTQDVDKVEKVAPKQEPAKEKGDIEQADVPDWLEAMRPIESVLPEQITPVDDKKVEQSGPLAGLRAVLPSTPSAAYYRKPPIYSVKLQVSEKQRAHAAMLENLLEDERRVIGKKAHSAGAPLRVMRVIIALFLIVAVLLPILGIPEVSMIPPTSSVVPFYDQIEAVPTGAPVLVAVDYAPGYAGEMAYAGTGFLQRMMARELRIASVSTLPTGPVLAEGMKTSVFQRDETLRDRYENRDWFINLGYLPGEIVSLQEFAQNPRQAVQYGLSTGLENRPVWDSSVLLQVNALSDFALVVLLTDTVETGRAWIEQVQPALDDVPLLVVSSAQAAPLLQPYVQSGQIQAMLIGMGDGLAYEEILNLHDDRRNFWLANQFGLLAMIFIILVGALIEGISFLVGRNRSDEA